MAARRNKAPSGAPPKPRRRSGVCASSSGRVPQERRHERYGVDLPVRFVCIGDGPEPIEARCANLSLGGMFIASDADLEVGAVARIWVTLPDHVLFVSGEVRWVGSHGVGIRHTLLDSADTHALTTMLAALPND